jgi:hypothetical protein
MRFGASIRTDDTFGFRGGQTRHSLSARTAATSASTVRRALVSRS